MRVAAIVLAAGESRRMGRPKMTLPYGGSTLLETVVDALRASRVESVTVVLGPAAGEIAARLAARGAALCVNPRPADGMLSSAQRGLACAPPGADAFLFALGDQPGLDPRVVDALAAAAERSEKGLFVPVFDGRRGHPLLVRARCRDSILSLPLSVGLNHLARAHPGDVEEVPVDAPAIHDDIDTPDDYRRAVERSGPGASP